MEKVSQEEADDLHHKLMYCVREYKHPVTHYITLALKKFSYFQYLKRKFFGHSYTLKTPLGNKVYRDNDDHFHYIKNNVLLFYTPSSRRLNHIMFNPEVFDGMKDTDIHVSEYTNSSLYPLLEDYILTLESLIVEAKIQETKRIHKLRKKAGLI